MYRYIKKNRIKVLIIPLILYWIILFIGTTLPSDHLSYVVDLSDKLKHFIAYFGLSFLLSLNFHFQEKWKKLALYSFISALVIASVYGMLDEIHQMWVPNRSAEFYDWIADFLGSIIGVLLAFIFVRTIKNKAEFAET